MTLSPLKLEAALVSMAGTAIHLTELASGLEQKPVVAKSVEALMPKTQSALTGLQAQFLEAMRIATAESEAFVTKWLDHVGLPLGGLFEATTRRRYASHAHSRSLKVRGGISDARLCPHLVAGVRVMDLTLVDGELALADGRVLKALSEIPVREQADFNLMALRDFKVVDPRDGVPRIEVHVRVPIQGKNRDQWRSSGVLVRD